MQIYEPPMPATSLPVIDIGAMFGGSPKERRELAREVHVACRQTGFFYIANHHVPREMITDQFRWAKLFFDLPLDEKLDIAMKKSPTAAGYEPLGAQRLDSQDASAEVAPPDIKETFYCGMELADDHPWAVRRIRNFGHNQWPAALPGFRVQMIAYWRAMAELGNRVLALLALSLDLPEDWFVPNFDYPTASVRLIKYPPHPQDAQFNQIGAGAHTDWGGITILAQDSSGGLEVRNAIGDWIEATPVPETFVVNLGDLMARWTNGIYKSNMHRVKNSVSGGERYSVPFFYGPRPDAVIAPMPGCAADDRPQRFATCTAAEHMTEMFRRSYGYAPGS